MSCYIVFVACVAICLRSRPCVFRLPIHRYTSTRVLKCKRFEQLVAKGANLASFENWIHFYKRSVRACVSTDMLAAGRLDPPNNTAK